VSVVRPTWHQQAKWWNERVVTERRQTSVLPEGFAWKSDPKSRSGKTVVRYYTRIAL